MSAEILHFIFLFCLILILYTYLGYAAILFLLVQIKRLFGPALKGMSMSATKSTRPPRCGTDFRTPDRRISGSPDRSFIAQRLRGQDPRGPQRRLHERDRADGGEHGERAEEREPVGATQPEQESLEHLRGPGGKYHADQRAQNRRARTDPGHSTPDRGGTCSQGLAHADLLDMGRNQLSQHAVEPDRGEDAAQQSQRRGQASGDLLRQQPDRGHVGERIHARPQQVGIDLVLDVGKALVHRLPARRAARQQVHADAGRLQRANRYLVLIAYLFGLAIGVHLLNLLAIFFIALIVFFTEFERSSWSAGGRERAVRSAVVGATARLPAAVSVVPSTSIKPGAVVASATIPRLRLAVPGSLVTSVSYLGGWTVRSRMAVATRVGSVASTAASIA